MTIGIISSILDFLFFYIMPYHHYLFFPMFTIVSLISFSYFRKSLFKCLLILIIYMSLSGLFFYPILYFIIIIYFNKKNKYLNFKEYINKVTMFLLIFDLLFFLLVNFFSINYYTLNALFYKLFISIPINILYSCLVFKVLKRDKYKYKLV